MHLCAGFLLLFEFLVLICNMYDVTFYLYIDFGGHIGASSMCCESFSNSVLPYWPSSQNGVSEPKDTDKITLLPGSPSLPCAPRCWQTSRRHEVYRTPPLCDPLLAVAMWQAATSCENSLCTCCRNKSQAENSICNLKMRPKWGEGGGVLMQAKTCTMNYTTFQLQLHWLVQGRHYSS